MTTVTGRGFGKQVVTYEDSNILRAKTFPAELYANFMRGRRGMSTVFRQVLPPTITEGDVRLGCGKLPDPTCLTSFEFTASITKSRKIDEMAENCDVNLAGELMAGYLANGSARWATHEARKLFEFIGTDATETAVTGTNNRIEDIEGMILELEESLVDELGDLAPERSEFIVLVNSKVESELRSLNFHCCALADQTKSSTANYYGVKQVTHVPRTILPSTLEILVYVPNFAFGLTMCTHEFSGQVVTNQFGYRPNTMRFFGEEDYGFESFHYLDKTDTTDGPQGTVKQIGYAIKKSVTPPVIP